MASKYTLWLKDYTDLTLEVKNIPLVNIKEVLSVGGQHFVLSMGKDSKVEQDDHDIDPKYMRQYFTDNKDEFYDVLEILRTRVTEQREFAINVCNALTEQAVPEVVMARMRGEDVSGDAFEMLKLGTRKKLDELAKIAKETKTPFEDFEIKIPVAGQELKWDFSGELLSWGEIEIDWSGRSTTYNVFRLESDMFFLTNFAFIEAALRDLATKLANVLN